MPQLEAPRTQSPREGGGRPWMWRLSAVMAKLPGMRRGELGRRLTGRDSGCLQTALKGTSGATKVGPWEEQWRGRGHCHCHTRPRRVLRDSLGERGLERAGDSVHQLRTVVEGTKMKGRDTRPGSLNAVGRGVRTESQRPLPLFSCP